VQCRVARRVSAWLMVVSVSSCGPQAIDSRQPQYDGGTVDLTRPTVVGYFLYSQREVNNERQLQVTLAAFQKSLDRARSQLERQQIRVVETYRDSITLRWPDGSTKTYSTASREDGRVGYHLFHPETTPIVLPGGEEETDLVEEAHRYFRPR
jgi:hypothetical protein